MDKQPLAAKLYWEVDAVNNRKLWLEAEIERLQEVIQSVVSTLVNESKADWSKIPKD